MEVCWGDGACEGIFTTTFIRWQRQIFQVDPKKVPREEMIDLIFLKNGKELPFTLQ
jgi:hypothetical protein